MSVNQHIFTKKLSIGGLSTNDLVFSIKDTGAMLLPAGTSAQRPLGDATEGCFRLNKDTHIIEWFDGSQWVSPLMNGNVSITELDPVFVASPAYSITNPNKTNWTEAYNKRINGFTLQSGAGTSSKVLRITLSDGTFFDAAFDDIAGTTGTSDGNVDTLSFNTGNGILTLGRTGSLTDLTVDLDGRYLQSYTETDPVFLAHPAHNITTTNINNWTVAYNKRISGFSLQAGAGTATKTLRISLNDGTFFDADFDDIVGTTGTSDGNNYPTSFGWNTTNGVLTLNRNGLGAITIDLDGRYVQTESDPIFIASPASSVTTALINNWNAAYAKRISGFALFSGAGTATKTLRITLSDGTFYNASFDDMVGAAGTADGNNYPTTFAWDTTTGVLTLNRNGLAAISVDLDGRYLQSETDPVFGASPAAGITSGAITNWNTAYNKRVTGFSLFSGAGTTTKTLRITFADTSFLNASFDDLSGSAPTLPNTQIAFGNSSNQITSSSNFVYANGTLLNNAGANTSGGVSIDGTSHPAYILRNAGTIRGALGLATANGGYFTNSLANDLIVNATLSTNYVRIGAGAGNAELTVASNATILNSLVGTGNRMVVATSNGSLITLPLPQASTGEANTSSNVGLGIGLALAKNGVDLPFRSLLAGTNVGITFDATTVTISAPTEIAVKKRVINFLLDGGDATITTGLKGTISLANGCTITKWRIVGNNPAHDSVLRIDIKKSDLSSYPTTTSIVGAGTKPAIVATTRKTESAPSSWTTTAIEADSVVEFEVVNAVNVTKATLTLYITEN